MIDPLRKAWTFGQPDDFISFWPLDIYYCNAVLQEYRAIRFVIELGTYLGGSACLWASAMQLRDGHVLTLDNGDLTSPYRHLFPPLCQFVQADIREAATQEMIRVAITTATSPVLLFCDNGDKPAEVRLYGPMLREHDVLMVHDWHDEHGTHDTSVITPKTAPAWLSNAALWEPVRADCWGRDIEMHVRAWRRTGAPWVE